MNFKKIGLIVLVLLVVFFSFVFGIILGRNKSYQVSVGGNLGTVLNLVQSAYVDTVNIQRLENEAIPLLLSRLDPHSTFLSKEVSDSESERLDGSFSGVGIQFNTILDTAVVVKVTPGGPSERAGLMAGDRLLKADGKPLIGKDLSSEDIRSKLKGPKESVVVLDILRDGKPMQVKVLRDDVPVPTLDVAYMISPNILYLKLNGWGLMTQAEVLEAYSRFQHEGIKGVIMDVRDNGGGYLDAATSLASEFLPENKLVLYAKGNEFPKQEIVTERTGRLVDMPLVVLIDEFSASSSEIFSGAMQDHDRALIVGRRSFGKGLVQRQFVLPDSSAVRLTVARYYTPSGRCIQKKYNAQDEQAYAQDIQDRYMHGELFNADSIHITDSVKYYTDGGRVVYGGGGIIPDVFVPRDSVGVTSYYLRLLEAGVVSKFAFIYADSHRAEFSKLKSVEELCNVLDAQGALYRMAEYAMNNGIQMRTSLFHRSYDLLRRNLYSLIAENFFDREGFYRVFNASDKAVQIGQEAIINNATLPLKSSKELLNASLVKEHK